MRVGGRKEKAPDSSAPSSEEQGATSHDSRRPAAKPYSLTPPSPGRNIQPRYRGVRRCWASFLFLQRHQSLDTRSITSTGTSERAVTLKMPSLAESIVGADQLLRGRQSLSEVIGPDTKGSSQHIVSRVQRSNPSRPLKWNFNPRPAHIIHSTSAGSDREAGWFWREGPEIRSSEPRAPLPSRNRKGTRYETVDFQNDFSHWPSFKTFFRLSGSRWIFNLTEPRSEVPTFQAWRAREKQLPYGRRCRGKNGLSGNLVQK